MWVVYSGEVSGEVGTRSGMCCVGWVVWLQGFCNYMLCLGNMDRSTVSSCVYRDCTYIYTYLVNIECAISYTCIFYSYSGFIDLRLYKITFKRLMSAIFDVPHR